MGEGGAAPQDRVITGSKAELRLATKLQIQTLAVPPLLVECWVMKYRVYLEPDEDGVFVATCPALPGCISQGRTRVEATDNIREAIEGYLMSLRKHAPCNKPDHFRMRREELAAN